MLSDKSSIPLTRRVENPAICPEETIVRSEEGSDETGGIT
jgi:hypothetical protein